MSIRDVIPTPTPVSLGPGRFLASEFRLRDLATIQSWIDARLPSPYDEAAPILESPDRPDWWKRFLSGVVEAQESWPRELGDPEAEALVRSEAGRKLSIALALAREHPRLDAAAIDAIHDAATVDQYNHLMRVAWGVDPIRAMATLIDGPPDEAGESHSPDWVGAWDRYHREYKGGPAFPDLTITQFRAFMGGGQLPDGAGVDPSRVDRVAESRRRFFGED